jgi:Ca-activated chloride channel family protein
MPKGIDLSTIGFAQPAYLWLLAGPLILLFLWIWQVFRRRATARRYRSERLLPVRESYTSFGDLAFWFFLLIAASLCIVALARPRASISLVRRAAADIVVLQDGSASMYVSDVAPDRWRRSMQFLRTFAETLSWKGDRVALALFAQIASPQLRLTKDPNALFFFLDHLGDHSPFRLVDNPTWDTNIEEGIYWGLKIVQEDENLFGKTKNPKGFLVITDGQAWSGNVSIALTNAKAVNIPVYVIGVGTITGGIIPEPSLPFIDTGEPQPEPVHSYLDRDSLIAVARAGGGEYFELGRQPDRELAFKIIGAMRSRAPATQIDTSFEELYWWFFFAAAVCLCLGTLLLKGRAELWWQAAGALAMVLVLANIAR